MSREDIFEVEMLEREQLADYEAQMQESPCASCGDCYTDRKIFPCVDCSILDLSRPISHWKHYANQHIEEI